MTFTKTVQKSESWLKDLMEKMDWEDKQMAYDGLRFRFQPLAAQRLNTHA